MTAEAAGPFTIAAAREIFGTSPGRRRWAGRERTSPAETDRSPLFRTR